MAADRADLAGVLRAYAALSGDPAPPPRDVLSGGTPGLTSWARYPFGASKVFSGKRYRPPPLLAAVDVYERADNFFSWAGLDNRASQLFLGWLWFAGVTTIDGVEVSWCFPAISVPVKQAGLALTGPKALEPVGDPELTPLIEDRQLAQRLLNNAQFGGGALRETAIQTGMDVEYYPAEKRLLPRLTRLNSWGQRIAAAVGLRIEDVSLPDDVDLLERRTQPGIGLVVTNGVYLQHEQSSSSTQASLKDLSRLPDLETSAFGSMFGHGVEDRKPRKLLPLGQTSKRQERALAQMSSASLSALSGPPGTGKTHVLAIAAADAVAAGQSVLMVATTRQSVEVLVDYMNDLPGPQPIVFDGSLRAREMAVDLIELANAEPTSYLAAKETIRRDDERRECLAAMFAGLAQVGLLEVDDRRLDEIAERRERAGDRDELVRLIDELTATPVFRWLRRRSIVEDLSRRLGAGDPRRLLAELDAGEFAQRAIHGETVPIGTLIDELHSTHPAVVDAQNTLLNNAWLQTLSTQDRPLLKEIGYALSSTRAERASTFTKVIPGRLTRVAPLWVGTLADVERILPAVPAMFDLVILDEAAQTNPIDACGALLRGKSAVVCGDPVQLGHSSFLSNEEIEAAAAEHGVDPALINPRSQSAYDIAAARVPAAVLDEHFRSDPHVIEFSARRFYGGALHVMTRKPSNDAADHIDVHVVDGGRGADKTNEVEVAECLRVIDVFAEAGWTSIGLVSPFRAQADAIREAVLEKYRLEDVERLGLRTGTVHSFQGDECRLMIMSWAVGRDEGDRAWQFVNQENLFNVMVTRAREHVVVVTSNPLPPGRAGDFVRWAEPFDGLTDNVDLHDPWISELADHFQVAGLPVQVGYRVGHHVIDLVVGDGEEALALDCTPHVDGPDAHLDRALHLRRMGWRTADAYGVPWSERPAELVAKLTAEHFSQPPHSR